MCARSIKSLYESRLRVLVILQTIPNKGKLLTSLSKFWFEKLGYIIQNHFVTDDLQKTPDVELWDTHPGRDLVGRVMLVQKCEVLKCEAIVRGYLTGKCQVQWALAALDWSTLSGSAYAEYLKNGTVHGISLPSGLPESVRLDPPIFTPSTKAAVGEKDENVHPNECRWTKRRCNLC